MSGSSSRESAAASTRSHPFTVWSGKLSSDGCLMKGSALPVLSLSGPASLSGRTCGVIGSKQASCTHTHMSKKLTI